MASFFSPSKLSALPSPAFPGMIPRSKLARNLATTARRSALASRQYATASSENDPSSTTPGKQATRARRMRQTEANSVVRHTALRIRKAERDERVDITVALTEAKT